MAPSPSGENERCYSHAAPAMTSSPKTSPHAIDSLVTVGIPEPITRTTIAMP